MEILFKFINNETRHFNKLGEDAKRLILSFFLYGMGVPLLTTFMNAFIWKNSHDFIAVALYNIGSWATLPFVFFINGVLLQYISIPYLYTVGLIVTAMAPFIVIALSVHSYIGIAATGVLFGIGYGLYWANRNFYTLRATESMTRNYFFSLTFAIDTITSIAIPFAIGWFIVYGDRLAYLMLAVFLLGLYIIAGIVVLPLSIDPSDHSPGLLTRVKGKWNMVRLTTFGIGLQSGSNYVLPVLMILSLLGNEGVLGTISSFGSLLSAFAIYQIGKIALVTHRVRIFATGIFILVCGVIFYVIHPAGLGIIAYVVAVIIASEFTWISYNPVSLDIIDQCTHQQKNQRFKYLVDQEFFLDLGRIVGVGLFFFLYFVSSRSLALRFALPIIAGLQIGVLYLINQLSKKA